MQCHVLAFEGPDLYAQAGGVSSRVMGLTEALAAAGFEMHLWFVGDPSLPGYELREQLHLHRWCQWSASRTFVPWHVLRLIQRHPSDILLHAKS